MIKCDNCKHKGICKYEENMDKMVDACEKITKENGFSEFIIEVKCKHFYETGITKRNI